MARLDYDLIIIGTGVTGSGFLNTVVRFVEKRGGGRVRILVIERRHAPGQVNSNTVNNSQTLHTYEIESNYGLATALRLRPGSDFVAGYVNRHAPDISLRIPKMLLGCGAGEVDLVTKRYHEFKPHFPEIQLLDRDGIAAHEPKVMEGRDPNEPVVALYTDRGLAVDYRKLSESFVAGARKADPAIEIRFNQAVDSIVASTNGKKGHVVKIGRDEAFAPAVMVAAGSPSLGFAHKLGYGLDYAMLPVGASFARTRNMLNGKVYCPQLPKLPWARLHGDPAVYDAQETRFGPTVSPTFLLERNNWATAREFLDTGTLSWRGVMTALTIGADWDIAKFLIRNKLYEVPFMGRRLFLRDIRGIVPSLQLPDMTIDKGAGGIRGQLIDLNTRKIARGHDKITGEGIKFIMAPSPGASYCLGNALEDTRWLVEVLGDGFRFDEAGFRREYATDRTEHIMRSAQLQVPS